LSRPLVSVIMNCLNGARYLREAIDSVFSQTYPNWEIVFWDNASSDESGSIARSYGEKVRYFKSDTTTSLGTARNKAFAQCKGEYIAILDADDIWLPEKLESQLALFETKPELGMVFSDSICFDEKKTQYRLFKIVNPKRGKVFGDLLVQNFAHTIAMMYRRKALETLPYVFDAQFNLVMDYDVSLRVAYLYELDYVKYPLCKWRMHSGSQTSKKRFLVAREQQILIEKLCREVPDIKVQYKEQVNRFLIKFVYSQLALEQWYKGNRSGAREYLFPYLRNPKYLIVYLSTWILPYNLFDKVKIYSMNRLRSKMGGKS